MAAFRDEPTQEDRKAVELIGGPADGANVTVSIHAQSVLVPIYQSMGLGYYSATYRARNGEPKFYFVSQEFRPKV